MRKSRKERLSQGLLRVREVAHLGGVAPSTIRYYTNLGILKISERSKGGHKLFDEKETLARLRKIKSYHVKQRSLQDIKKELVG